MKSFTIITLAAAAAVTASAANPWQSSGFFTDEGRVERIVRDINAAKLTPRVSFKYQAPEGTRKAKMLKPQAIDNASYKVMSILPAKPSVMKSRADGDEEEGPLYNVSIKVDGPNKPDFYLEPPTAYLINEDGYSMGFIEDPDSWQWGGTFDMYFPVAAGTYSLMVQTRYAAPNDNIGSFVHSQVVEITEDCTFAVDLAECSNFIHLDAQMPNGEPFPVIPDDAPDDTAYPFAVINFETGNGNEVGAYLSGIVNYNFFTNDMPAEAAFHAYVKYYDVFKLEGCAFNIVQYGPFTEDTAIKINADGYKFIDAKFHLTEDELHPEEPGIFFTFSLLTPDGNWLQQDNTSHNGSYTGPSFSDIPVYMYLPQGDDQVSCYSAGLGTVVGMDYDWWEEIVKHTPQYMSDNGTLLAVPNSARRDPDTGLPTFLSAAEVYNIKVDEQAPVFFSLPPYLTGNMEIMYDWDDPEMEIVDFWGYCFYTGPYFETCSVTNPFNALVSTKLNGVETPLEDMMGESAKDASFEFTFKYDASIERLNSLSPVECTIGYNTRYPEDINNPYITGFQLYNADGKITDIILPEEEGTLYFSAIDADANYDHNGNITTELQISAAGSEEWTTLECVSEEIGGSIGMLYSAKVEKDLAVNLYDVKITITDAHGNYMVETIHNCFVKGKDPISIRDIAIDGKVQSVRYYDLNGREMSHPAQGISIKASTLDNGQVKAQKVVTM